MIDLNAGIISSRISLATNPEGVAVGADGRVLITADWRRGKHCQHFADLRSLAGSGKRAGRNVPVVPTPATPPVLPTPSGRIYNSYRSRLLATPDGKTIIGINGLANGTERCVRLRIGFGHSIAGPERREHLYRTGRRGRRLEVHGGPHSFRRRNTCR